MSWRVNRSGPRPSVSSGETMKRNCRCSPSRGVTNLFGDEVFVCRIKSAAGAVALDAVALEIFQVVLGRLHGLLRPKRDVARLDHAAPAARVRFPDGHAPGSRRPLFVSTEVAGSVLPESAGEL